MIAEVHSRVGFKEEQATPPPPRPSGGGFQRALSQAAPTEGTPPRVAGSPADPRNAAVTGAHAEGGAETTTAKVADGADSAAAAQRIHLQAALLTPVAVASQAAALQAGEALVATGEAPAPDPALATGSTYAQIGRAAYRIGPHGMGELQFALAAGAQLPAQTEGAAAGLSGGAAVDLQPEEMLQQAQTGQVDDLDGEALAEFRQKAARQAEQQTGAADPAKAQGDQARHQLLAQLGTATNRAAPFTATARTAGDAEGSGTATATSGKAFSPDPDAVTALGGLSGTGAQGASADRTAAVHPGAEARPEPRTLERIVQSARWLIGDDGTNEVTIKLHPENLGQMRMKVMQEHGLLRLEMTVHNQAVKHLIESQMDTLREMLMADNLAQGQFQVSVDVQQRDPGPFGTDGAQALAGLDGIRSSRGAAAAPEAAVAARTRPTWGQGGVGIYV